MKVARFAPTPTRAAVAGLLLLVIAGVAICLHAMGVLAHVFPKERPIPPPYPAWTATLDAVTAGLTLSYGSGPVEGKMIKRQMFGRANFDLLRKRLLLAA